MRIDALLVEQVNGRGDQSMVLEAGGRVIWMKGVELEREPGLAITAVETAPEASQAAPLTRSK